MSYRQVKLDGRIRTEVGTIVIDIRRKGIGRIKKSSGTDNEKIKQRYVDLVDRLYKSGNLSALRALKNNKTTFHELYEWDRSGNGKAPPWEVVDSPLEQTIADFFLYGNKGKTPLARTTQVGYRNCYNQLIKSAGKKVTLNNLPSVLEAFQKECNSKNIVRTFNQAKSACQGLVRYETKVKTHPLYLALKNIEKIPEVRKSVTRNNKPFSVSELDRALLSPDIDERLKNTIWLMCLTGMGPREYLTDGWEVDKRKRIIKIFGQKTASRFRSVPLIYEGVIQEKWCEYKKLRLDFKKLFPDRQLYDCRRTFKTWCIRSDVTFIQQEIMMGHVMGYRDNYGIEQEDRWLPEVGKKLYEYIQKEQITRIAPDITPLAIPNNLWERKDTLQNAKLKTIITLLNDTLKSWHDDGKMKRKYRIDRLIEFK